MVEAGPALVRTGISWVNYGCGGCHVASSRREARQGRRTFLVRIIFSLFSADLHWPVLTRLTVFTRLFAPHISYHTRLFFFTIHNSPQLTAPIESHTTTVTNSSANSYRISTRVIHSATTLSHPRRRRALSFRARSRDEHILPTSFQPTTASSLTGPYTSCYQIPPSSSQPIPSRYNTCN